MNLTINKFNSINLPVCGRTRVAVSREDANVETVARNANVSLLIANFIWPGVEPWLKLHLGENLKYMHLRCLVCNEKQLLFLLNRST